MKTETATTQAAGDDVVAEARLVLETARLLYTREQIESAMDRLAAQS